MEKASAEAEEIAALVKNRGITEVVHFTSNVGLVHILKDGWVLSRTQLNPKHHAERVMNARVRWDDKYFDYISLSLTWINAEFFEICKDKWYADTNKFWVLLSFDASILEHEGVIFVTTNNGYGANAKRKEGAAGLERLFGPRIDQRKREHVTRESEWPDNWTTCPQAEALYLERLSLEHLRRIYVYDPELRDEVLAQAHTLRIDLPELVVDPSRFQRRRLNK